MKSGNKSLQLLCIFAATCNVIHGMDQNTFKSISDAHNSNVITGHSFTSYAYKPLPETDSTEQQKSKKAAPKPIKYKPIQGSLNALDNSANDITDETNINCMSPCKSLFSLCCSCMLPSARSGKEKAINL